MAKEECIEAQGEVVELCPSALFRVRLDNGHMLLCHTNGRIKKHRIRIAMADKVTVEMTPYDLDKGRISFRHKS